MDELEFEVDSLDGIEETYHGFYQEKEGGGFRLKVKGIDDGKELKTALQKEREARKQAREELEQLREQTKDLDKMKKELERLKAKGKSGDQDDIEQLKAAIKERQDEIEELRQAKEERDQEYSELQSKWQQRDIREKASQIARKLAKSDPGRADVLTDYAQGLAEIEDGEVVFKINGLQAEPKEVEAYLIKKYPFLVDGTGADGGGAPGSGGNGVANLLNKKSSEMSQSEKSQFIREYGFDKWQEKIRKESGK